MQAQGVKKKDNCADNNREMVNYARTEGFEYEAKRTYYIYNSRIAACIRSDNRKARGTVRRPRDPCARGFPDGRRRHRQYCGYALRYHGIPFGERNTIGRSIAHSRADDEPVTVTRDHADTDPYAHADGHSFGFSDAHNDSIPDAYVKGFGHAYARCVAHARGSARTGRSRSLLCGLAC